MLHGGNVAVVEIVVNHASLHAAIADGPVEQTAGKEDLVAVLVLFAFFVRQIALEEIHADLAPKPIASQIGVPQFAAV